MASDVCALKEQQERRSTLDFNSDNHLEDVMSLLRAFGRCTQIQPSSLRCHKLRLPLLRPNTLAATRCVGFRAPTLSRLQSSTRAIRRGKSAGNTYPTNLNVFNSGQVPALATGFIRVFCYGALVYGVFWTMPSIYNDPSAPSWMLPAVICMAFVPILATGIAYGGYVHQINLILPSSARRSKEDLLRFARRIPHDSVLEIKCMWFRPWPITKHVWFEDLRRLPHSQIRLSNLEHVPLTTRREHEKAGWMGWLVRSFMGRYWVSRQMVKDRSRVPGVWDIVWEQIPLVGQEAKAKGAGMRVEGKVPYAIANRAGRGPSAGTQTEGLPMSLPAKNASR